MELSSLGRSNNTVQLQCHQRVRVRDGLAGSFFSVLARERGAVVYVEAFFCLGKSQSNRKLPRLAGSLIQRSTRVDASRDGAIFKEMLVFETSAGLFFSFFFLLL